MPSIKMVKIPAASFKMGGGDYELRPDGLPVHSVTFSEDFYIAAEPVSFELFEKFYQEKFCRPSDRANIKGYAAGCSWHEADEFCAWLSEKDGKAYRLPTEAEWEYSAKHSLKYGIDRMCDLHLREWCYDWYAPYTDAPKTNPGGTDAGMCKVVRGGYLDNPMRYNAYPMDIWMRCSLPPNYCHYHGDPNSFGRHNIGFRMAIGPIPVFAAEPPQIPFTLGINQTMPQFRRVSEPYFRKRHLFPSPPDHSPHADIAALGLNPLLRHHNHSPGFSIAPNGDLMVVIYSSYHEYEAEVGLMAARLRYGADAWDMPDIFVNPVGVNNHAPCMFTDDDGTIYLFWGWQQLDNAFPFQYITSSDNGATWSGIKFPKFSEKLDNYVNQPINSVFRARDGYYYLVCDAVASQSVLWRTKDMIHWENPKSRTPGRHTTAVELTDGRILAMGGKNSHLDGYMPKAISTDGGDNWEVSKTPFPGLTSGQRPCIIRLASGRLFFCGDYQNKQGERPEGATRWGSYVAYSDDEGDTWHVKPIWGAQKRKKHSEYFNGGAGTLGYSVAQQGADGMIHIIATNVYPCLHFAFNEAWLLADEADVPSDDLLLAGVGDRGYLLHGEVVSYYSDGSIQTSAQYDQGKLVGEYTYFDPHSNKIWQWSFGDTATYTTYHNNGKIRSQGHYAGKFAHGPAKLFSPDGKLVSDAMFENGRMVATYEILPDLHKMGPLGGDKLDGQDADLTKFAP